VGTPSYMAPEQAQGEQVDLRCDIYSLGLVLFEMFTGSPAFTGETPITVALKQIQDAPKNPRDIDRAIPDHIAKAILRGLEKDPAKRFQSVEELQAAILTESSSQKVASKLQNDAPRTAVGVTGAVVFLLIAALIIFSRAGTIRQDTPLAPSNAEFAA